MIYNYNREIQPDGRYNIGYTGETYSLAKSIQDTFPGKTIKVVLDHDSVLIDIDPSLTTEEKNNLDTLISDHKTNLDPSPSPFICNESFDDPSLYDIGFYGLHKEEIIDSFGSLIEKNYYKTLNNNIYSELAIKNILNYVILPNDLVHYRTETIEWYKEDETVGITKTFTKYYIVGTNYTDAIKEGIKRRTNLIDKAKGYGLVNIAGTYIESGKSDIPNSHYFFNTIINEVELYIAGTNKQVLIDVISNSNEPFITQTIKDTLVDILKYW